MGQTLAKDYIVQIIFKNVTIRFHSSLINKLCFYSTKNTATKNPTNSMRSYDMIQSD